MEIATCVTLRVCNARVRKGRTAPAALHHGDAQAPALQTHTQGPAQHSAGDSGPAALTLPGEQTSENCSLVFTLLLLLLPLPPAGSSMMADVATSVRGGVLQRGTSAPSVTTPVRTAPTKAPRTAPAVTQVDGQQPAGKGQSMHVRSRLKRS